MKHIKLLNVEDSENDFALLVRHLLRGGFDLDTERVETAEDMRAALNSKDWDIIISDYQLPDFSGLDALQVLKDSKLDIPFIMISGTIGEETAVQAMIAGVNDYLMKDNLARLIPAIERELHESANRKARREAEDKLFASQKRLQLALSATGMGVWEWNLLTDSVYWSRECYEITKLKDFNETFQEFAELVHPEDFNKIITLAQNAIDNKTNYMAEFRIINLHGEIQWLSNFGVAEYDGDGKPLRLIGTVQDITKRKESEAALIESEERFRALVQATSQYIWTVGADLNTEEFPEWWEEVTGQPLEDAKNWGWINVIHPEDRADAMKGWKTTFSNKTMFSNIYRIINKNKEYRFFVVRGVPLFNPDGSIRRWIGALNDITERLQSENDLKQSEQRFRSLVNTTAQIVWTADPEGVLLTALTPYGEDIDETENNINEEWFLRIHPDDKNRVLTEYSTAIKNKTNYKCEYQMLNNDKVYRHYIARGVPVFEKDGNVREWIGTLTDVTENRLAEAELIKKEEQLRQAQKLESVGRLAGGIAHDFNNMLTVINGYSDLLLRGLSDVDPVRRKIEEIKKAGERAAELTNQLLAFSRRQLLQPKIIDVNQNISDTTVMLQRLIGEDIQVVKDLNANPGKIKADAGQLSQIIMNLLINARDAMPKGGKITVKTQNIYLDQDFVNQNVGAKTGNHILLKISDTGVGISEDIKNQIFEPFFTTKEVGQGTGLGLSTVYGIVNQFGGFISVKSVVGEGSTFEIYLPGLEESVNNPEGQTNIKELPKGTETILLVEDEKLVRKLTRQMLETAGYKVIEAQNGAEAINICEQTDYKFDMLITDVVMPKMSGRELADKLADVCPLVLFTSGYTDDAVMQHGIIDANVNFLQKPFNFEELIQKVQKLFEGK